MITSFKFNNCFAFNNTVKMNLKADMRTKKFTSNVINIGENNKILKSIAIYGPNNTGKTSFIDCIKAMKDTLENNKMSIDCNIFNKNNFICEESISFINDNKEYLYEFKYDCKEKNYIYEKMSELRYDSYKNELEDILFIKDSIKDYYECKRDKLLEKSLNIVSSNNILIYTLQVEKFKLLQEIKEILLNLAKSIEIVDMNDIPNEKTIEILKHKGNESKKVVEFIKNADLYLENFYYADSISKNLDIKKVAPKFTQKQNMLDQIKLVSVYKGKAVPSIIFDSIGTKKLVALASYVVTSIEEGKTLVIDELDSSLHFKITRAIMSMFNNDINKNAQLIATLHDVSLLDCKKMFRKEQIWFTDKDEDGTELYSLKDFSYTESGVRDTSDIKEKYAKGEFGAIPEPDLISALLEVDTNEDS